MEKIIGIDLGTTNSLVAIVENGHCKLIPDAQGNFSLPSCVGISEKGELLIGEAAKRQLIALPESTVKSAKREMGTNHRFLMKEKEYTPTEISAIILRQLKERASNYLGEEIQKAIITVPAYFTDAQRQATKDAGEIAGLEVIRILNEPTAAAIAYQFGKEDSETVMVYDLGGGTFDVSIVEITDGITEVRASHGNNRLGGDDFDQKMVNFLKKRFYDSHDVSLQETPSTEARLLFAAEKAKIALSEHAFVEVIEEYLDRKGDTALHLHEKINRRDFEKLIEPLLEETLQAIDKTLEDADLHMDEIDKVVLVGGSTRIPLVREMIQNHLNTEVYTLIDPDQCVALGAGYQAGRVAGEVLDSILVDVTPFSLGVSSVKPTEYGPLPDYYSILIPRNSVVPCTRSEIFTNSNNNPSELVIDVYQGEQLRASHNVFLGSFSINGLPEGVPSGTLKIEITFDFNTNGILKVTAKEENSDQVYSLELKQSPSRMGVNEIIHAKKNLDTIFDPSEKGPGEDEVVRETFGPQKAESDPEFPEKIQSLFAQASKKLQEVTDRDEKEDIESLMEEIKISVQSGDETQTDSLVEELEDILYYIDNN